MNSSLTGIILLKYLLNKKHTHKIPLDILFCKPWLFLSVSVFIYAFYVVRVCLNVIKQAKYLFQIHNRCREISVIVFSTWMNELYQYGREGKRRRFRYVYVINIMGSSRSVLIPQEEIQMICDETGRIDFELEGFWDAF